MWKKTLHFLLSLVLATLVAIQPLYTAPQLQGEQRAILSAAGLQQDANDDTIFLPIITAPSGPPAFAINSPINDSSIGGVTYFSIQPVNMSKITTVTFRAGGTVLGTDTDGSDGFKVFLNARDLPAGQTQLTATASGPGGETTETVTVTIVPDPPQSATVGEEGGVLASEIGSVISIQPGSVQAGTNITVDELTQEETTAQHGIDWESMGVTFLGAQKVESSAAIQKPFAMVASAGFGNRVQPGQAVVNYRIAPDADGDGVAEIVVVNTASIAPNNDVVSDPIAQVEVSAVSTPLQTSLARNDTIAGPPGTVIDLAVSGMNPSSALGNVAIFRSDGTGETAEVSGMVLPADAGEPQTLSILIPILPQGPATLTVVNRSTGFSSEPLPVTIEAPSALPQPAAEIVDAFFAASIAYLETLPRISPDEESGMYSEIQLFKEMRTQIQQLSEDPSANVQQKLAEMATYIIGSKLLDVLKAETSAMQATGWMTNERATAQGCLTKAEKKKLNYMILIGGVLGGVGCALALTGVGAVICGAGYALVWGAAAIELGDVPECKEPPECPAAPNSSPGSGTTGMGAAPPPGGNGCGNTSGAGVSMRTARNGLQPGSGIVVKIFSNSSPIPFTGMADPGGYFFVPLIPGGEPFTALALDTATGETRTTTGVGPPTGESTLMFFDFFSDDGSGATPIQIGDVLTGTISTAGELHLYSFTATAGQQVYFDVQNQSGLSQVDWQLLAPNGSTVFDACLGCGDPGVQTLAQAGTYILTIGEGGNNQTGTYRVQLWNVPAPDQFAISIGDVISDGVPGPGAGNIESPGVKDIYTFQATAGQQVYFDMQSQSGISQVDWTVVDEAGTILFNNCLGCGEPGVQTLEQGGAYILTVGDDRNDGAGTYRVQLWNVPAPDQFAISIGDVISDGVPGPGAGNIESPGVKDIYTFQATAGQQVYFDMQSQSGISQVDWQLLAPNGDTVFNNCLGCGEPGVHMLEEGGTYILTVGDDRNDGAGTYRVQLWNVPAPDQFAISVGDVISDGEPGPGAGNIESPGVKDIYTFQATAGQQVYFDVQNQSGVGQVNWQLLAPNGSTVFDTCLGCGDPGVHTLEEGGTYTLTVGDDRNDGVGTYQFQLTAQ